MSDWKSIRIERHEAWLKENTSARQSFSETVDLADKNSKQHDSTIRKKNQVKAVDLKKESNIPIELKLLSYNIWFGSPHQFERMSSIASIIKESKASLVAMQEVTSNLAEYLYPLLKSLGYKIFTQDGILHIDGAYGCAIAFKDVTIIEKGFLPFQNSIMDRGLLWMHCFLNDHPPKKILFLTSHLESWVPKRNGAKERLEQVMIIKKFCDDFQTKNNCSLCILTGDLNWDDEQSTNSNTAVDPPLLSLMQGWIDAWTHTCQEPGYTYDSILNPMLTGNLRRRYDRFLIRCDESGISSSKNIRVEEIQQISIIGTTPIPNLIYQKKKFKLPVLPSDHYALSLNIFFH